MEITKEDLRCLLILAEEGIKHIKVSEQAHACYEMLINRIKRWWKMLEIKPIVIETIHNELLDCHEIKCPNCSQPNIYDDNMFGYVTGVFCNWCGQKFDRIDIVIERD